MKNVPEGFRPIKAPAGGFGETIGPLYGKREENGEVIIGVRIETHHCSRPALTASCNGGMLVSIVDTMFPMAIAIQGNVSKSIRTITLNSDFIAPAPVDSWIEGRTKILKQTSSMAFVQGVLTLDGQPVMQATGVFRLRGEDNPNSEMLRLLD